MNKDVIENTLRNAPGIQPPGDLLATLKRDVTLPRAGLGEPGPRASRPSPWLRRWLPTVGFAAWFLGCVVVFGYQANRINELTSQQEIAGQQLAAAGQPGNVPEKVYAPHSMQAEQVSEAQAELRRLREEIQQLRKDVAELTAMRSENTRLRDELKAQAPPTVRPEQDFFAVQQENASRIVCINHLKQLALAAHLEANKLKLDMLTKQLSTLLPYLKDNGKYLLCSDGKTPYQVLSPGASMQDPSVVFVRCQVHNNVALVDGSAHQLTPEQKLVDNGNGIRMER